MVSIFYSIVFIASAVVTAFLLLRYKRVNSKFILLSFSVVIHTFGRYLLSVSTTLETALLGNMLTYLGSCIAQLMMILILCRLCKIKISKLLMFFLSIYSAIMMIGVFTIGKSNIYYKYVELGNINGETILIKEYGPMHAMSPVLTIIYIIILVYYLIRAYKNRKKISMHTAMMVCGLGFLILVLYLYGVITRSHIHYSIFGYLLAIIMLVYLTRRITMYDLNTNIVESVDDISEDAYIQFDGHFKFLGSNNYATLLFPEIASDWHIDAKVPENRDSYLYNEIYLWLVNNKGQGHKEIEVQGRSFNMFAKEIKYNSRKVVGYLLQLIDRTAEKNLVETIKNYNSDLKKEVEEKTSNISSIKDHMVLGMATMVERRDNSTGGHIKRTSSVVKVFSEELLKHYDELGLNQNFLDMVTKAAPMHDLGKIAIDDRILRKQSNITPAEFDEMKNHAAEGAKIIREILGGVEDETFVQIAENVAHYHHEKWNGTGYPDHLRETEIPVEARIMALADVFDALVSKRCYKEAYSYDHAFGIIKRDLGTHFDRRLGKIFLDCRPELEEMYDSWQEAEDAYSEQLMKKETARY